ncbi:hypothetical protein D9758_017905 [Tetrapyrgos nigripes]|uniref:Alpha-type protein kinase domain-containing protein n=1 Tax=Tetrapyrgos nigripes TaxID=182062 RepID=A0A8H5C1I9_9AGAR|nr:hypothetical protein D9758_017905 [Tetrapyrgos nigripes]
MPCVIQPTHVDSFAGGSELLTDPQIITSLDLDELACRFLFGEGNLQYEEFCDRHRCLYWCRYFGLQPFDQGKSDDFNYTIQDSILLAPKRQAKVTEAHNKETPASVPVAQNASPVIEEMPA